MYIYIALDKDLIVGYAMCNKPFVGVGFCDWLGVKKEYQNKGIGTALLAAYEKKAKEEGAHKVHLWSAEKNVGYYDKKGYILACKIPNDFFGEDCFLHYKVLQDPKEENYLKNFLKNK